MIAVLGGGVAGAAVALGLAQRGARGVTVFDPAAPGAGSTGRALGGFRTQHGSPLNIALSLASRPWFEARADRIKFEPNGYLYVAETPAMAAELERRAELQRECGLEIEHPDPAAVVPFLDASGYHGANFCALDGLYRPPLVLAAMTEAARTAGAVFRYGEAAPPEVAEGAEAVVVAAGNWSPEVGASLGVELAVAPLERRVWEVGAFGFLDGVAVPMTLEAGSGYHFRERDGSLFLMGPGDQDDWGHFRDWLALRVPGAAVEQPAGSWTGAYETTFDMHPLVGATERSRVWACCGFSGHGVMHSPVIGDCLAAMILGQSPPIDISALSPLRTEPLVDLTQL